MESCCYASIKYGRSYIAKRPRRKPHVLAIVASVLIFALLLLGVVTTIALINYEPVVPVATAVTTIYNEEIHSVDFVIGNAFYCSGCKAGAEAANPENKSKTEVEAGENGCLICARAEKMTPV